MEKTGLTLHTGGGETNPNRKAPPRLYLAGGSDAVEKTASFWEIAAIPWVLVEVFLATMALVGLLRLQKLWGGLSRTTAVVIAA